MSTFQAWEHLIAQIDAAKEYLKPLQEAEMKLRKELFAESFPEPKEGVNKLTLDDGRVLNGTYSLERKVDEAALVTNAKRFQEAGINLSALIRTKYELDTKTYRTLDAEQLAMIDEVITAKPASPTLVLKAPK
jgi:hypothetical protein